MKNFAYASPSISVSLLFGPTAVLQAMYAKYFGLGLTSIAAVILISRLFDAITDPIIGYYSDLYFQKKGSRKPFIITGGLLFIISSWYLYVPGGPVSTIYFLVWSLVFYFSYTMYEIPHLAWASDLRLNSVDKNAIYNLRATCSFFGVLVFFTLPLLPVFENQNLTPETLRYSVILASLLIFPCLYLSVKTVPDGRRVNGNLCSNKSRPEIKGLSIRFLFQNKSFILFIASLTVSVFGGGMWYALLFLYVDGYLGLGDKFALAFVISFSISILVLGILPRVSWQFSKKTIWALATLFLSLGIFATGLLSTESSWWNLLPCMTLYYCGLATKIMIAPSLLAEIIDYGAWKSGRDQGGIYFSIYTLTNKAASAFGGALGLSIAASYGFDVTSSINSEHAIWGMRLALAWMPSVIVLVSFLFIALIPLNLRHHLIIRRRLAGRTKDLTFQ